MTQTLENVPALRASVSERMSKPAAERGYCPLFLQAEAVKHAIVGADVNLSVRDGETGEMIERSDLVCAGIEFLARLCIQGIKRHMTGLARANRRVKVETLVRRGLLREVTAAISEDNSVGDNRRLTVVQVP